MKKPTQQEILAAHEHYADTPRATRFNAKFQWTNAHRGQERHILDFSQGHLRQFLRWRPEARRGKECRVGHETFPAVFMVDIGHQIGFQNVEDAYQALKRFVTTNSWFEDRRELRWLVEYASIHPVSDTPDEAARFALHVDALNELGGGKLPSPASAIAAWDQERDYESLTPQLMFILSDDSDWRWRARARYRDTKLELTNADALRIARAALRVLDECTNREHGTTFAHHTLGRRTLAHLRHPLREIATIDVPESPRRITTFPSKRIAAYRRLVRNAYRLAAYPVDQGRAWHADPPTPDPDLPQGAVMQLQEAGHAIYLDTQARARRTASSHPLAKKRAPGKKRAIRRARAPQARSTTPTPPPRPSVRVAVNATRLEELELDSATLRERLISDQHLEPATPPLEPTPAATESSMDAEAGEAGAGEPVLGVEEAEYHALLQTLTGHERRAVTVLLTGSDAALEDLARAAGTPVALLIDRINEKALETIGDVLIDTTGGTPVVFEEHADVLSS